MEMATGYYLNLYSGKDFDVFLAFNEPAGEPTVNELELLASAMEQVIANNPKVDRWRMKELLCTAVENTNCECINYGFQVLLHRTPPMEARYIYHKEQM